MDRCQSFAGHPLRDVKTCIIENTDIHVSRISFGTASLHHNFNIRKRQKILHVANEVGITHFDTSPYYGYGLAESDLGRFLSGRRAFTTVATKIGLYPWGATCTHAATVWVRKAIGIQFPRITLPIVNWNITRARRSLIESLRRLKTDYVDFVFLHEPDPELMATDELLRWLEKEQSCGHVRSWGIAGMASCVEPFVHAKHPLAHIVQTQDSLEKRQADFMTASGRTLQFTYGYLSAQCINSQRKNANTVLCEALLRNQTGTVLVSTRHYARLHHIAKLIA